MFWSKERKSNTAITPPTKRNSLRSLRELWLRVKHEDSIKLSLEIPIKFSNNAKGAKHIVIDPARLPYYLDLKSSDLVRLRKAGLIEPEAPARIPKPRIDYPRLAQEYKQKLDSEKYSTRSALARDLGVSRAWITEIFKRATANSALSS